METTRIGLENDYVEYKYPRSRTRHTSLPALLKGRVSHCRPSGKLLDSYQNPTKSSNTPRLNNVVTEAVANIRRVINLGGLSTVHPYNMRVASALGPLRQVSGTIVLASKVSGPKDSLKALLPSESRICTSGVAMAMVRCAGKTGIMGGKLQILRRTIILSPSPSYTTLGWRTSVGPRYLPEDRPVRVAC